MIIYRELFLSIVLLSFVGTYGDGWLVCPLEAIGEILYGGFAYCCKTLVTCIGHFALLSELVVLGCI